MVVPLGLSFQKSGKCIDEIDFIMKYMPWDSYHSETTDSDRNIQDATY